MTNREMERELFADEMQQAYDSERIREYIKKNPDYFVVVLLADLDLDWEELTDEQKAIMWP